MADFREAGSSVPTVTDVPRPRTVIADHELLHRIGEGSYGEVWLARNVFGEYRAVKIVYRRTFQDQRPYEREFRGIQRFEPISRAHEGHVDILHVGRNDAAGYFYYIMELADDLHNGQLIKSEIYCAKTLKSLLVAQGRLTFAQALQLGLNLTAALDHLHQHNLVHRDIKPSNIIFLNGTPRLADIGLVADISEARSFVGTEGFIPPEGPGTVQADVYSLGKVLYLVCLAQKDKAFPDLPDNFDQLPDKERLLELNEIILKACEGNLKVRYKSAADMRADLLLLEGGKSVKRLRLVERRLAIITKASVLMTCLAVLGFGFAFQISHQKRVTTQRLVRSHVEAGTRLMDDGDFFGALLWFAEALQLDAGDSAREENHRIRIASVLRQCPKLVGVFVHEGPVNQAAFSPDGRHLATASDDKTAGIWDLASGERLFSLPHNSAVYQVVFSPDGKLLATADRDNWAHLWDAVTGKPLTGPLKQMKHRNVAGGLRFSPDGKTLVTFPEDEVAQLIDVTTGAPAAAPLRHEEQINSLAFHASGREIITTTHENDVSVWDAIQSKRVPVGLKHQDSVTSACFSPDGHTIATASDDTFVRLWEWPAARLLGPPLPHHHWIQSLCFSPQGDRLLTGAQDRTAQLWSVSTHNSLLVPLLHSYPGIHGIFTPDGRRLVTSSGGIYARVWSAVSGAPLTPPIKNFGQIKAGNISADGRLLTTINRDQASRGDQAVRVWDLANGEPPVLELTPVFQPYQPKSPDGRLRVIFGQANTARVLEMTSGRPTTPPLKHFQPLRQALFSSDSKLLVTETLDSSARIWDPLTGEALSPFVRTKYVPGGLLFGGHAGELRWPTKKDLPFDGRSTRDLMLVAELMSGNRVDAWGGFVPLGITDVTNLWARLRLTNSRDFTSSQQETVAWHERAARSCESDWDWWGARFHLNWLLKLQPGDEALEGRLAYAQLALNQEQVQTATNRTGLPPIPPRDPLTPPNLIDLSPLYNASFKGPNGVTIEINESPTDFPFGMQQLAGVTFDVRGLIQLSSDGGERHSQVVGIKVGQKCRRLNSLLGTKTHAKEGTHIGSFILHLAGGTQQEVKILYGRDVRVWAIGTGNTEPIRAEKSAVAWMGLSPAAKARVEVLRLFKSSWENVTPTSEIVSIDFMARGTKQSPFLVALTVE